MKSKNESSLDGVKCFTIGGRMIEERQRRLGMTDEERRWRAQWLKDQVLSPDEPKDVDAYYKDTTNIFRRIYKTPMYWFHKALRSRLGPDKAFLIRHFVGKMGLCFLAAYIGVYYIKYHSNDFTTGRTLEIFQDRKPMLPSHPDYPYFHAKEPYEYYDLGFYSSVLCQDAVPPEPPPPPPPPPPMKDGQPCSVEEQQQRQ